MAYDAQTGTVIDRSNMHLGLKRNFQVMPGAQWLELLCRHIPDRYEHLGAPRGLVLQPRARRTSEGGNGQKAPNPCAAPTPLCDTAHLPGYLSDFRSDLIIFQAASPGNRHSQKVHPLTGLPVIETAAADGESNRLPSRTSEPPATRAL